MSWYSKVLKVTEEWKRKGGSTRKLAGWSSRFPCLWIEMAAFGYLNQSEHGGTGALGISFLLAVGVINAIELRYSSIVSSRSSLLSELPSLCSGLTFTNSFRR